MIKYIDLSGKVNSMPKSIWDELPANKGGLKLAQPIEAVKQEVAKEVKPVETEDGKPYPTDAPPSEEWTVPQLRAFAKDNDVNLGRAKSEKKVLEAIRKAGY